MRHIVVIISLSLLPVAAFAEAECKTAKDCERVGPKCCSGECEAVPKKQAKARKKEIERACAVKECEARKGPAVSCTAVLVCMEGQCTLGNVKAWDADKKKDDKKKDDEKKDAPSEE